MHLSQKKKNTYFLVFSLASLLLISSLNVNGDETNLNPDNLIVSSASVSLPLFEDFLYYKNITINSSMVSELLIDYPLLISLIDSDLKNHTQADGDDITFFINSEIADYEIELFNQNYNDTHSQLIAWIRIPYLYPSESLNISMCFGNSDVGSHQKPENVWSTNYKGVWHFSDGLSSTVNDSTSNSNDGTVEGEIYNLNGEDTYNLGNIGNFTENDAQVECPDSASLEDVLDISIDFWFKLDSVSYIEDIETFIIRKGIIGGLMMTYTVYINDEGKLCFRLKDSDSTPLIYEDPLVLDRWYHVYCTREVKSEDNLDLKMFIDGVKVASIDDNTNIGNNVEPLFIGSDIFNGCIDEVRLSNTVHSVDWIRTEYRNQNDPESFYSVSARSTCDDDVDAPVITYVYTGDGTDENPGELIVNATDDSGLIEDINDTHVISSEPGTYFFSFNATDADNERDGDSLTTILNVTIVIVDDDFDAPVITCNYTGNYTDANPGKLNITATDDSGLIEDPSGTHVISSEPGTYCFSFNATDADNDRDGDSLTTILNVTIVIDDDDVDIPVITYVYTGDGTDENPGELIVIATDASGLTENSSGTYDVSSEPGIYDFIFTASDNDNDRDGDSLTTKLKVPIKIIDDDVDIPVITYVYTGDGTDENPGIIIISATDASGLTSDPSGTYNVSSKPGTYYFHFTASDNDNDRDNDSLTTIFHVTIEIIDPDAIVDNDDNQLEAQIMFTTVMVLGLSTLILGGAAGYLEVRHVKNKKKDRIENNKKFRSFRDRKRSINKAYAFSPNPGIETEIEDIIVKKPDYVITERPLKIPHHRVLVTCPTCKVVKELSIPDELITKARRITVISVPNDLTCKHHYLLFMDRHFEVRGYQGIDFEVRIKKVPRIAKNSEEFNEFRKKG